MRIFIVAMANGIYSVQLAKGLAESGHHVAIAVGPPEGQEIRREVPKFLQNPRLTYHTNHSYSSKRDIRHFLQFVGTIAQIFMHRSQVVHIAGAGYSKQPMLISRIISLFGIPVVTTVHDAQFHPGDNAELRTVQSFIRLIDSSRAIIVHGKQIASKLSHNLAIEPKKVFVIPRGNNDIYLHCQHSKSYEPAKVPTALLFGRMRRYKGLHVLLDAAEIIYSRLPAFRVVIAGKGPELDRFEERCHNLPNVEVHNKYISFSDLVMLHYQCTMVIIPYIEASQSSPLNIAFSFGKPVVATRVGAIPEVLRHGEDGLLVAPGAPKALAEAMLRIGRDPILAEKMSVSVRAKANGDLSWSGAIAAQTGSVYKHVLNGKSILTSSESHFFRPKRTAAEINECYLRCTEEQRSYIENRG
ncbi:MAG: glycosyltransferase [Chitinivibrionales bacterium]|nr:glycosyltransferase [Chitinivibrionales bacterium]MBD3356142.1 glycosyltransferase [Chitinivibrionales bacterium]